MAKVSSISRKVRFNLEEESKDTCVEGKETVGCIKTKKTKDEDLTTKNKKEDDIADKKTLNAKELEKVKFEEKEELFFRSKKGVQFLSVKCDDDKGERNAFEEITGLATEEKIKQDLKDPYDRACRKYGATPASLFLRQCTTSVVDMKHYGLGDKGVRAIAMAMKNNQTLECLNLHDNGIGGVGIRSICNMMACNSSLKKLDLSGNRVGKPGVTALGEMLKYNVFLQDLNLSDCGILAGSDVEAFIHSLGVNNQLESLNLSNNEIGDSGAICLGTVLLGTQSLRCLDISWNSIHRAGAEALCRGLSGNASLMELDLSWNGIGNPGAECIKQALIDNKSLKILNLSSNHISMVGIKNIAQALQRNRTLQVLKIGKNPFLSSGASMILKSLLTNQHSALCELLLEGVVFNEECETCLSELLEQNPIFLCTWDVTIKGGSVVSGKQPEPMELLFICISSEGFRLIDFYRILTNDYTGMLLKKEEFVAGIKKRSFPFSDKQLRALFDVLDTRKCGSITFEQFIMIKNYKQRKNDGKPPRRYHGLRRASNAVLSLPRPRKS